MIPAVERGLSWTELPRLPGQTGGTGTISGAVPLIHGVTGVTTCTASPATVTLLRVLGQPCHPCPLLLTSERAKWGLQMGRGDSFAAKIILGFRQRHTPSQAVMRSLAQHHLVVLESESSSMSPHWSKYTTGKRKHRTPWSRHGKISLPWASVLTHFLLSPPPHARLVTVPGVNSIWQLLCRLTASQGAPGDPQVALLPLLTSVLWATLMATWQAGDRWM